MPTSQNQEQHHNHSAMKHDEHMAADSNAPGAVSPSNTLDQPGLVPGTLPWLESNEALALATRMETRLPWRPTRGSLTSPSYLVRKRTLGPPLENNPKTPPSSRDEGLRLLHG